MSKSKKDFKDFKHLQISEWNSTTFREYCNHLNIEKFGIPTTTHVKRENFIVSSFVKTHSKPVLKRLIELGVQRYRPNKDYPTINLMTLITFYKTLVPSILKEISKETSDTDTNFNNIRW